MSEKKLAGQSAIVTGASSGIGKAIAEALAAAGARVLVNYHSDEDEGEKVARDIGGVAFGADTSKEGEVDAMFAEAEKAFGAVDILVANAGVQKDAAFDEMSLEDWNAVIAVNLTGQFLCARAAVRAFKRRGMRPVSKALGKILHVSSVHETIPWAGHANYAASKGGIQMLMKTLAQEVAPLKIRVNSISPGAIRTPINKEAWETPEKLAELMKLVPMKRIGEPEDIGKAAVFLASDDADYITGVSLVVDGGMTLYPGFESGG